MAGIPAVLGGAPVTVWAAACFLAFLARGDAIPAADPVCHGSDVPHQLDLTGLRANQPAEPFSLRYERATKVDGECVTMEIYEKGDGGDASSSTAGSTGQREPSAAIGQLSIEESRVTGTQLFVRFLTCGGGEPVTPAKLNFTIFSPPGLQTQKFTLRGYAASYLGDQALFRKEYTEDGTEISTTRPCRQTLGSPDCAVTFFFKHVHEFPIILQRGEDIKGSIFYFGGSMCGSAPVCTASICGAGLHLKASDDLPATCQAATCTEEECCDFDPGLNLVSSCKGHETYWEVCDGLPECDICVPKDCKFSDWTDWSAVGGCSGLCQRTRDFSSNNECGKPCDGPASETVARLDDSTCFPEHCRNTTQDCRWGDWSDWTPCQGAETAQSNRKREVVAHRKGNGAQCEGDSSQTRPCELEQAVDCKLSQWGDWTICSRTCDTGWHARVRRVLQQPLFGGKPCGQGGTLALREESSCATEECSTKQPCVTDDWSDWEGCNLQQRYQKFRSREILMSGDRGCDIELNQTSGCGDESPLTCSFTEWTEWTECSASCGGQSSRGRRVIDHTSGRNCSLNTRGNEKFVLDETRPCGAQECNSVDDCVLSDWSDWAGCSTRCGEDMLQYLFDKEGAATRQRRVIDAGNGDGCNSVLAEAKACNTSNLVCEPVDCEWGDWESWSRCSVTCGGGRRQRSRSIKTPPKNGGKTCEPKSKSEVAECATTSCFQCIDGAWRQWSEWSTCSGTCTPAYRVRHRDVELHPNYCGKPASGVEDEYELCDSLDPCVVAKDCEVSPWQEWSECSANCFGVQERQRHITAFAEGSGKQCVAESMHEVTPCNPGPDEDVPDVCGPRPERPCKLGTWSDWTMCTVTCGEGQKGRSREILSPATNGGAPCNASLAETIRCDAGACDSASHCHDCEWTQWSEWSSCNCGGQRERERSVRAPPSSCGKSCDEGLLKEVGPCTSHCEDELYCAWSEWTTLGACSATCGMSTRMRQRSLNLTKEKPTGQGFVLAMDAENTCEGDQVNMEECPFRPCFEGACEPKDCAFGDWSDWGEPSCDNLCERHRIIAEESVCGGLLCTGPMRETKQCTSDSICSKPVDCVLGEWAAWHPKACDRNQMQRYRARAVLVPARNGGAPCDGALSETKSCSDEFLIPKRDCVLGSWQEWTACTEECGGGLTTRLRKIEIQSSGGGAPCAGPLEEFEGCNNQECLSPAACKFGIWDEWTSCYGAEMKFRRRNIAKQPSRGGQTCNGPLHEGALCDKALDCIISEWTSWDECDRSCGGGQQERTRLVLKESARGGEQCPEDIHETRGCSTQPCSNIDCMTNDWSDWGTCGGSTCGKGYRTRTRDYIKQRQDLGHGCNESLSEVESCDGPPCPCVDCVWGHWEDWGACSCRCDGGQRLRERRIVQEPEPGCKPCEAKLKAEIEPCNTQPCHSQHCVNGLWDDWGDWGICSSSCEGGVAWRSRPVKAEANECGKSPEGYSQEHRSCNADVPCTTDVDCEFGDWSSWSACSAECGGVKKRSRTIAKSGEFGGSYCTGPLKQTAPCQSNTGLLDWGMVDGYLDLTQVTNNNLGYAGPGTGKGNGTVRLAPNIRFHNVLPRRKGDKSVDLVIFPRGEYSACDVEQNGVRGFVGAIGLAAAPDKRLDLEFALVESATGEILPVSELALRIFLSPGAGVASSLHIEAQQVKENSVTENTGLVVVNASTDRIYISLDGTQRPTGPALLDPTNATVDWLRSAATLIYEDTAKIGLQITAKGAPPSTPRPDVAPLQTTSSQPFDCVAGYANWHKGWSEDKKHWCCAQKQLACFDCSAGFWNWKKGWSQEKKSWCCQHEQKGCDTAEERRLLPAATVDPASTCATLLFVARACTTESCSRTDPCKVDDTAVDCVLGTWTEWSLCSASCATGQRQRSREVIHEPANGGRLCEPALSETEPCNAGPCHTGGKCEPTDCLWGDWGEWGACDRCGGQMKRSRPLLAAPTCGGNDCEPVDAEEVQNCTRICGGKIYCTWGEWRPFEECSATCGQGLRSRSRYLHAVSMSPTARTLTAVAPSLAGLSVEGLADQQVAPELAEQTAAAADRSKHVRVLALSFAAGCLSLVLFLASIRGCSRRFWGSYTAMRCDATVVPESGR